MSPKLLKNGMKPSLFPVQISKFCQGASPPEPPSFWGPQSAAPKPLPRLFLDLSYGPNLDQTVRSRKNNCFKLLEYLMVANTSSPYM